MREKDENPVALISDSGSVHNFASNKHVAATVAQKEEYPLEIGEVKE